MVSVRFLPADITVKVPQGSPLLEAARIVGVSAETPCGGMGTCKKCLVKMSYESNEDAHAAQAAPISTSLSSTTEGSYAETVLICQAVVPEKPITVTIDNKYLESNSSSTDFTDNYSQFVNNCPMFLKSVKLTVTPPALLDGLSDSDRFNKLLLNQQIAKL